MIWPGRTRLMGALVVGALCVGSGRADAQTATPASTLSWEQEAPDLATAQAYVYRTYADNATVGVVVTGVTCVVLTPGTPVMTATCTGAFPAFTPGSHTICATAANAVGESLKSNVLAFTMVVTIPTPLRNLRVTKGV
jgi:hypothetical protein